MSWKEIERRFVGKKFRRRKNGLQETCLVIDCTLGGDVVCRTGRSRYEQRTIRQEPFLEWVKESKKV